MKKLFFFVLFSINLVVLIQFLKPTVTHAEMVVGNNVTCYEILTIGEKTYSVYDCDDCKRTYCENYSGKSSCYFKNSNNNGTN